MENQIIETDWNSYYAKRVSSGSPTRKITEKLILSELKKQVANTLQRITEFGGGDSCFYQSFKQNYPDAYYVVVDKSCQGIQNFLLKHQSKNIQAIEADLLKSPLLPIAELVYSVGLIEHFDVLGTKNIIKVHFDAVIPGGLVLITYPTPSYPYRIIRGMAEFFGIWRFPDERPLLDSEVFAEIENHGTILAKKMNWLIGLTQRIVIARKRVENA